MSICPSRLLPRSNVPVIEYPIWKSAFDTFVLSESLKSAVLLGTAAVVDGWVIEAEERSEEEEWTPLGGAVLLLVENFPTTLTAPLEAVVSLPIVVVFLVPHTLIIKK